MVISNPEKVGLWEKVTVLTGGWEKLGDLSSDHLLKLSDADRWIAEVDHDQHLVYIVVSESFLTGDVYMRGNSDDEKGWVKYGSLIGFA